MNKRFGVVILAAGLSRRMGRQKLLLPLNGNTLLGHVLATASRLDWSDWIVVVGDPREQLTAICDQHQIRSVFNPNSGAGQASSIALGLQQLDCDLDGILFLLGDQPFVSVPLIQALRRKFVEAEGLSSIVVPQYQGQNFSPVLFGAAWRDALAGLQGDEGGRSIIRTNQNWVVPLDWPKPRDFCDADTWNQYQTLLHQET